MYSRHFQAEEINRSETIMVEEEGQEWGTNVIYLIKLFLLDPGRKCYHS